MNDDEENLNQEEESDDDNIHEDDEDEEKEEESFLPMWKTVGIIAVLIGCFLIVYPKMFHPLLMGLFGMGSRPDAEEQQTRGGQRGIF